MLFIGSENGSVSVMAPFLHCAHIFLPNQAHDPEALFLASEPTGSFDHDEKEVDHDRHEGNEDEYMTHIMATQALIV